MKRFILLSLPNNFRSISDQISLHDLYLFIHSNLIRGLSLRVTYSSWSIYVSRTSTVVCEGLLPLALGEGRIALVMPPKSGVSKNLS